MEEFTRKLPFLFFTATGAPPTLHCTEGVGTPWKEQLHCSVFSKEQEASSSLAGAVEGEVQESASISFSHSLPFNLSLYS
jgi:hypothetical protein